MIARVERRYGCLPVHFWESITAYEQTSRAGPQKIESLESYSVLLAYRATGRFEAIYARKGRVLAQATESIKVAVAEVD